MTKLIRLSTHDTDRTADRIASEEEALIVARPLPAEFALTASGRDRDWLLPQAEIKSPKSV